MINRGMIQGLCIGLLFLSAFLGAEFFCGRGFNHRSNYLPGRNFWRLDRHTNLIGQFDGKEKFVLWHGGVDFDEKVVVRKPVDVKRIIVLGTSSAEGFGVPRGDNFASRLQYSLDSHYRKQKFEVINAAVGGYVSYQLLVYFQEVLLKLSPDIVILYLANNDMTYVGPFTAQNYYKKVQEAFLDADNDHEKKERLVRYGLNGLCPLYPLLAESRLFGYLLIKTSKSFVKRLLLMPSSDQEYVLREFVSLSKQYDFKLIFAPEMERRDRIEFFEANYYPLMRKVAKEGRVPFLNMMPSFREYPDDKVFLENDPVHLTPFGHQLVANKLSQQIQTVEGSDPVRR